MAPCTLHSTTEEQRKQKPYNQEDYKTSEYNSACVNVFVDTCKCVYRERPSKVA